MSKTVSLWGYPSPLLIIPHASGIIFEQQTGGVACTHHSVEGIMLPVPVICDIDALNQLYIKLNKIHPGCAWQAITDEEADALDATFLDQRIPLVVNRAKLQDSTEAWLHVLLRAKDERWLPPISEEEVQSFHRMAQIYNPTPPALEEVRELKDASRIGDTAIYADFSGQEAILTWLNCD